MVLKALLRRKLKCPGTLWLLDTILDTGPVQPEAIVVFPGDTLFTPYERRRGLPKQIGCHTFRANGITAFLKNGGDLATAQKIAGHESARTTNLYDRTQDELSLDEIERILI